MRTVLSKSEKHDRTRRWTKAGSVNALTSSWIEMRNYLLDVAL